MSNRNVNFDETNDYNSTITDQSDSESGDLTMDLLPESFRFTSAVSMRSASNIFEELILDNDLDDDEEESEENEINEESNYGNTFTMYVQTNSKLKIILLCLNTSEEQFQIENTIRVVSE